MSSIVRDYIDINLVSGSSERLRTLLESSWEIVSSSEGQALEFNGNIDYLEADGATARIATEIKRLRYGDIEEITGSTILSSFRFPIRIFGSPDMFDDSFEWSAFVKGGTANGKSYDGFYNENIYYDHYISCELPYGNYETSVLGRTDDTGYEKIKINPVYNYYLREYENHLTELPNLAIPNIYFFQTAVDVEDSILDEPINTNILNYITRENEVGNLMNFGEAVDELSVASILFSSTKHEMLPPEESLFSVESTADADGGTENFNVDLNYNLRSYLTGAFTQAEVSSSTTAAIVGFSENQIFDSSACQLYLKEDSSILTNRSLFPYYVNIEIPADYVASDFAATAPFRTFISQADFVHGFMKNLAKKFGNTNETSELLGDFNCVVNSSYKTGSEDSLTISSLISAEVQSLRMVDYIDFLVDSVDAGTETESMGKIFIGENLFPIRAATEGGTAYEYFNRLTAMDNFNDVLDYVDNNEFGIRSLSTLYNHAESSKYYEIMAYRVEKISSAGGLVCDYWVFNDHDLGDTLTLVDTQVRYNDEYTYNVYLYKLIYGLKYNFSDAVVAESLALRSSLGAPLDTDTDTGAEEAEEDEGTLESPTACVQFKKVSGGAVADMLYGESSYEGTFASQALETVEGNEIYMADMYLNYEPSIKLVEIPIYSKTLKVLDNPPATLDIMPYQLLDNSRTIGFKIKTEAFSKIKIPSTVNSDDEDYVKSYASSKDMLSTDKISVSSRSPDAKIEVYRLEEKPASMSSFNDNLLKTYDLAISDEKGTNTYVECEDIVETNKKYYYMFRSVNSQGIAGPPTEVYETELINDGGYNYVNFVALSEEDLEQDVFIDPIKTFKKLINLKPNLEQIELDDTAVDYSQPSYTQLDSLQIGNPDVDDSIWNKTFKLRLTSKKTGKKIDLNITYNVSNG
jgi:hypothetical protein